MKVGLAFKKEVMNENDFREETKSLRQALAEMHRSLLNFQKEVIESLEQRKLTPHDVLRLSLSDPTFEWLRPLSALLVKIDEAFDDKELKSMGPLYVEASAQLRAFFFGETGPFKNRMQIALSKDPSLWMQLGSLRKTLKPE